VLRSVSLAATLAILVTSAGCGSEGENAASGSGTQSSEPAVTYSELLTGLKRAALADKGYKGTRRGNALPAPEESVLDAFCEVTWKLKVNGEFDALTDPNLISFPKRIQNFAETKLSTAPGSKEDREQAAALAQLDSVVDLDSFDVDLTNRYKRACYT
jgi:hypothetical protein